ncbi:MAG TPA: DUF4956 domain-containing protein [Flavobacteriales bacterium]|nr:DUF4956 domain-containing protein [Flavobacteriales bacterium]HIA10745.1 DUF4956 domain-containing protein [Flavobacteriales bacterium]HIB00836.1 DUF4956 domain-containing protein [Phycisphaerales bacterium]
MLWELEFIELTKVFGVKLIDTEDFLELITRFGFNLFISVLVVRYIYYPVTKRKDYLFTYLMFSVIVFFLCQLLSNVKLGLGFALGLFAIFGIIRYRTDPIPIKEMTYLFVVIGISAINGLANKKISYTELVFTNFMIAALTYGLEKVWLLKHESRQTVIMEKIELIKPENHQQLLEDLRERTGLNIHRTEIGRIDFLRDTARVRVFYYEEAGAYSSLQEETERRTNAE